jgi:sarcosine oxidase
LLLQPGAHRQSRAELERPQQEDLTAMAHFDVVVCGLGVMGSATLRELACRRLRVLGIERFAPGHDRGSSHGETRIIRLAYFEHPSYVPLLRRSYELWRDLERASGTKLVHLTGIAEMGPPDGVLVKGVLASATTHELRHDVLAAKELMRRFPAFRLPPQYVAVVQPDGGFVDAEPSIHAMLALARDAGAEVRVGECIGGIEPYAGGVRVVTDIGTVDAGAAIVTMGPWVKSLLPGFPAPLRVTRQAMAWFAPNEPALFADDRCPTFLIESRHGIHYGFPSDGEGRIKVAKHHHGNETVDPDDYDRKVSTADEALIRAAIAEHLPAANGRRLEGKTCLYTVTPDGDFIIDRLSGWPQVIVASPCSGHGFKFAPVIGEILADLAIDGTTRHDIGRFSLERFG